MSEFATITSAVRVAADVYAPGHLGELTQYLPFEAVDDVLEQTRAVQRRLRNLPSRVGVYFVLALGLFPKLSYLGVWHKLTAGLVGIAIPRPSEKALRDLRRRLGPAPLKALFELVAGPLAQPYTPGVRFAGLRTVAFDGLNSLKAPDSDRNRGWMGRIRYRVGFAGYPTLRLMTLVETGTRALLGAVIGSAADRDEASLARRLLPLLHPGMLLLVDRAFDAAAFLKEVDQTGARLLVRGTSSRRPPVLAHLPDGSYLSRLDGLNVRIIEADLAVTGADGSVVQDGYRLITTLLDHRRFPAAVVVRLYHERWEIEVAYLGLRHTMLAGRVLRSHDRPGLEQEIWALLTVYQLLHMAMVTAVEAVPGTDPDRASFTSAVEAARDQLTAAHGVLCTDDPLDLLGAIGRTVLATLLPARRPRYSARKVKCSTSRYHIRDDSRPTATTTITAIDIAVHTPPLGAGPCRERQRCSSTPHPAPPTRRDRITQIMNSDSRHAWSGAELAVLLQVPARNLLTQLAEWTRLGFLTRTGAGTYAPIGTSPSARSPDAPNPPERITSPSSPPDPASGLVGANVTHTRRACSTLTPPTPEDQPPTPKKGSIPASDPT